MRSNGLKSFMREGRFTYLTYIETETLAQCISAIKAHGINKTSQYLYVTDSVKTACLLHLTKSENID